MVSPAKKERILTAAAQVFTSRGFHSATVDEIAHAAGVAKGTIYLYFPGKKELFSSLLLFGIERIRDEAAADLQGVTDPVLRLRTLIRTHLAFGHRHLNLARFLFESVGGLDADFIQHIRTTTQRYIDFIQEMLDEGAAGGAFAVADARVVAHAVLGLMNAGVLWFAANDREDERVADILADLTLNGIARNKTREVSL